MKNLTKLFFLLPLALACAGCIKNDQPAAPGTLTVKAKAIPPRRAGCLAYLLTVDRDENVTGKTAVTVSNLNSTLAWVEGKRSLGVPVEIEPHIQEILVEYKMPEDQKYNIRIEVSAANAPGVILDFSNSDHMALEQTTLEMYVPDKRQLLFSGPGKAVWNSSDPSVAVADGNGNITALTPGGTLVTVSDGLQTGICWVHVNDYIPLTGLKAAVNGKEKIFRKQRGSWTDTEDNTLQQYDTVEIYEGFPTVITLGPLIPANATSEYVARTSLNFYSQTMRNIKLSEFPEKKFVKHYEEKPGKYIKETITFCIYPEGKGNDPQLLERFGYRGSITGKTPNVNYNLIFHINQISVKIDQREVSLRKGEKIRLTASTVPAGIPVNWEINQHKDLISLSGNGTVQRTGDGSGVTVWANIRMGNSRIRDDHIYINFID